MMHLFLSDLNKKISSSFGILLLILTILLPGLLLKPQEARAAFSCPFTPPVNVQNPLAVPTYDIGVLSVSIQNASNTNNLSWKECLLDFFMKVIVAAVIHQVVSSIIDWINRGFEGGPTFVTNPTNFFKDIADQELGRMIDGSALGFVCDPLRIQLQFSFLAQRNRYRAPPRCTITSIVNNYQNFVDGNFEEGGWKGWFEMARPQNNVYGSYIIAQELLDSKVSAGQSRARLVINWGRGFRSLTDSNGNIKMPGAYIEQSLSKATGLELDGLNLAREFDDIIVALANLGITKLMEKGLGN